MNVDETIVAQASAQGNSRRGIVRLSGDAVLDAVAPFFFKRRLEDDFPPDVPEPVAASELVGDATQTAVVPGWLAPWRPENGGYPRPLVRCALLYWPKGRGFTGETAIELHLPGASPILDATVRSICETKKARLARRGEFTLRAFLSGRIDLTQAEAVLGVIDAAAPDELQTALRQLAGGLSRTFAALRETLVNVLCDLEAGFDFVDEDIEFVATSEIRARLLETIAKIDETLRRAKSQGALEQTPRVALAGKPNAGKSSLFNALCERFGARTTGEALVSNVAGTTRDFLEAPLRVDGVPFVLVDAAGIERRADAAEKSPDDGDGADELSPGALAQRDLTRLFADATLVLRCRDAAPTDDFSAAFVALNLPPDVPTLDVATKRDELFDVDSPPNAANALATSASTGRGVAELGREIANFLRSETENGEIAPSTALRCQEALRETNDALRRALDLLETNDDALVAAEIRLALDRLGLVTGETHTDDLLDRIFSKFCVGK